MNTDGSVGSNACGREMRAGKEEGAETVPVALAWRAGDDVVERGHDAFD